jgi:hypothetical protein
MRIPALLAAAFLMSACADEFSSDGLKVAFHPPHGATLVGEAPGRAGFATFSNGLEVHSVDKAPPPSEGATLDALLRRVSTEARVTLADEVLTTRASGGQPGPSVRWVLGDGEVRTIVFYVAARDRYLLFVQRVGEGQYQEAAEEFDRTVDSLRLLD